MHKTSKCPWPWTKVYLLEHGLVTSCSGLAFWPAWGALPWWPLQHGMHLVHRLDTSTVLACTLGAHMPEPDRCSSWNGVRGLLRRRKVLLWWRWKHPQSMTSVCVGHWSLKKTGTMNAWFRHVQMHFREKEQRSGGALGEGLVTSWRNFGRFHFALLCSCPLHLIVRNRYRCKLL